MIPIVADSTDSTAGFRVVAVIASLKVLDFRYVSSDVDRKFMSPQRMSNVEFVILEAPTRSSSVRKCLAKSD